MELISREEVIEVIPKKIQNTLDYLQHDVLIDVEFEVDELPTVEAVPVVHGKWIKLDGNWKSLNTGESLTVHQCSECGNYFIHATYNFCPHCGADMRKKV